MTFLNLIGSMATSVTENTLPFLALITVLVFVHEMGHFLVARYNGVRIEVFSIGFGPELWGRTDRRGTRWKVSMVPLGGYVKMFGEGDMVTGVDDAEDRPMTPEERAVSFHHKRLAQRAAIVFAGPLANFVFAIVVMTGLFAAVGTPKPLSGVGQIQPDSAAAAAGFKTGDTIVAIDGQAIRWFDDLRNIVSRNPGKSLRFDIVRNNRDITLDATPARHVLEASQKGVAPRVIGLLGVSPDPAQVIYQRMGIVQAVEHGVGRTYAMTAGIMDALGQMIRGTRNANELGGPISIAIVSADVAQTGLINMMMLAAAFSVNLGLLNLFPVPMLDGGHLVFYAFEALRGRPLSQRTQEYGFRFGLVLVFLLMIFATWNDFVRLFARFGGL
ncbi:RIP metalloprotease RseP [Varunaivibrio sulfuroxidans]|uniref:Zinc metalloprotease n=1 Tax=Varunaivibrio sulfuroxidans TaxID=1773489 RepID=A0A4R3JH96_9PROT|nr:RIP metalloprotease RseP [Varunaivibrio sulfuroxidans]TCS64160.1 site-2 protease [Varunaivibrio sulfuroxidans]WES31394.1 RIP metalloprotease RseP [Varunaivibrio sulfuroxidans]